MPDRTLYRWRHELDGGWGLTPSGWPTPQETRTRLASAVAQLAIAIDAGEVEPIVLELRIIAGLCDDHQLPTEAARVRRWMGDAS